MIKLIFCLFLLVAPFAPGSEKLEISVKHVQVGKGSIVVEIYNAKETFFKKPVETKTVKASGQTLDFSFDVPDGVYAVAAYQDINENKELDKGIFNIPKEPYGLSNNYRPKFSAPTFDDCKFNINRETTITIILK